MHNKQFASSMQRWLSATIIAIIFRFPTAVGFTSPLMFRHVSDTLKCHHQASEPNPLLRWGTPPYIAVLTESDACKSAMRVEETVQAIEQAVMCGGVNLVVLRVDDSTTEDDDCLKWMLLNRLAELRLKFNVLLVVNNDVEIVLRALSDNIIIDGVHVKEHKAHMIPSVRSDLQKFSKKVIIGTSCHSLHSATISYNASSLGPDYLFVGTCYLTQSHPEKQSKEQLEGPSFPGRVKQDLHRIFNDVKNKSKINPQLSPKPVQPPIIFAIGGIDEQNCQEPVTYGADGVAVIRTVMQASDPRGVVLRMKTAMKSSP